MKKLLKKKVDEGIDPIQKYAWIYQDNNNRKMMPKTQINKDGLVSVGIIDGLEAFKPLSLIQANQTSEEAPKSTPFAASEELPQFKKEQPEEAVKEDSKLQIVTDSELIRMMIETVNQKIDKIQVTLDKLMK